MESGHRFVRKQPWVGDGEGKIHQEPLWGDSFETIQKELKHTAELSIGEAVVLYFKGRKIIGQTFLHKTVVS